jgi:hypothetical protein
MGAIRLSPAPTDINGTLTWWYERLRPILIEARVLRCPRWCLRAPWRCSPRRLTHRRQRSAQALAARRRPKRRHPGRLPPRSVPPRSLPRSRRNVSHGRYRAGRHPHTPRGIVRICRYIRFVSCRATTRRRSAIVDDILGGTWCDAGVRCRVREAPRASAPAVGRRRELLTTVKPVAS